MAQSSAATFKFLRPGRMKPKNMLEEIAARERRFTHQRQFVLVLHLAQWLTSGAASAEKEAAAKPELASRR